MHREPPVVEALQLTRIRPMLPSLVKPFRLKTSFALFFGGGLGGGNFT